MHRTLALALFAPTLTSAQGFDDMQQGLTMLESAADRALERYGIDADPQALTIGQLGAIHGLLSSDMSEGQIAGRIEAIVNR